MSAIYTDSGVFDIMTAGVHMAAEIGEAADAVRRQQADLVGPLGELVAALKARPPQVVVTCARGSSGHAATFAKHLIERRFGIPVAAAAPNIASVYRRDLRLQNQLFLAVSQSGRSDDLVAQARSARNAGALTAAIVNETDSPLAQACDIVLPMAAGPERSVAATKTFVASLGVILRLVAGWDDDAELGAAIERLPGRLGEAARLDWSGALPTLQAARSLIAIGRGPTLAIAREAALKLKETCNLHAEAFSGAEVLHGPVALVANRYPVLMFMVGDETAPGMAGLADGLVAKGAAVYVAGGEGTGGEAAGGGTASRAGAGSPGGGRGVPDPELLQAGARPRPEAAHRRRPSAPPAKDYAHEMNRKQHAIAAEGLFDGGSMRSNHAVVIEGETIVAVVPRAEVPGSTSVHELPVGAWLAPGFIDVQVNGGGDRLFNDDPGPETIRAMTAAHRKFGTTSLLPTLITDSPGKMRDARAAVEAAMADNPGVLGIHFEGPWLSPDKPGIHDVVQIRAPEREEIELVATGGGVTLVTLAPEEVPPDLVGELARSGVRVALGHSMATYAETKAAMAQGLTGFTHLFNAMRPIGSREPGPIVAALETPGAWYGMIVDGFHVDAAVLKLALRSVARPMLVTDAMPPVGGSRASFDLQGREISVSEGRCAGPDGTLAGAALDMGRAVRNCVEHLDMPLTAALRAASAEPARFLGITDRLGRIAPGCRADMVALDPSRVEVLATWVAGEKDD